MNSSLNNMFIDYKLLLDYDVDTLIKDRVIPLQQYDYFTTFAVCSNSSLDMISSSTSKHIYVEEQDICFYLDDIDIKVEFYHLIYSHNENSINIFFIKLLDYALSKKSSDIHLETMEDSFSIRFRIDGILKTFFNYKKESFARLVSLIKLVSKLDITEQRIPQNGRFSKELDKRKIDFRVSTMPTILGESIVIRILNEADSKKEFSNIGFSHEKDELVKKAIMNRHGLILVTGPTGSGKTTTLYSILQQLNSDSRKIITIEDPVEYQIKGIQQIAINNEIGLSFPKLLRDVLRQDPDVILIGEIRDKESLSIAVQASLTGHLVLSTLHTNDAISSIHRLFDLDAKPYLISNTLKMIIAQRLVLKLCRCKKGCRQCNYTKFSGRMMINEVLEVDEIISKMITKQKSYERISSYLKKIGFKTLLEDGNEKVQKGLTTYSEVYKVIQ